MPWLTWTADPADSLLSLSSLSFSEPAIPVKMPSSASAVLLGVGSAVADDEVTLTRRGSWAPQGLSSRHEDAHALSLQASTHWFPHSMHMWYGSVREYSDMLGFFWSPQIQP